MRRRSLSLLAILGILAFTGISGDASAQSRDRRCYALEDELARLSSLSGNRGGGAEVRRWDEALREAAQQLDGLERRSKRARCNGGGFLFTSPDPRICVPLDREIAETRERMARLSRNRAIAMRRSGGAASEKIAQVREQLTALNCNAPTYRATTRGEDPRYPQGRTVYEEDSGGRVYARPAPNRNGVIDGRGTESGSREGGLFGMLFGGGNRTRERDHYTPREDRYYSGGGGTYRTLCVRRCDGFFFPISFSTTEDQFFADADQCQSMCPGTEASLYVYRNPGEDASAMVSLDGTPYSEMENAFRYRTEFDASCTCKSTNMSVAGYGRSTYTGDMTPVTGENGGKELNSSSSGENDWGATPGYDPNERWSNPSADSSEPWDPNAPWDASVSGDPNDPWGGYREPTNQELVTDIGPMAKLAASEDPDTILNQRGSYVLKLAKVTPQRTASAKDAGADGEALEPATHANTGPVRRVGPKYFVAQ